jgi:hypothetical protein
MAKKQVKKKDDTLKIYGTLDEVLGVAVKGNPKPRKPAKKKK